MKSHRTNTVSPTFAKYQFPDLKAILSDATPLEQYLESYPRSVQERLAEEDYLNGSPQLLIKLIKESTHHSLSAELSQLLCKIVLGEARRPRGRPRNSAQDDPLTRVRIYAQIIRAQQAGISSEKIYEEFANQLGRTPRLIRRYYEEFSEPPPR